LALSARRKRSPRRACGTISAASRTPMHSPQQVSVRRWSAPPVLTASVGLHAVAIGTVALAPEAWPWALGGIGLNHVGLAAAGLWPRSQLLGANMTRLPAAAVQRKQFALTLDDGPDPEVTPRVL